MSSLKQILLMVSLYILTLAVFVNFGGLFVEGSKGPISSEGVILLTPEEEAELDKLRNASELTWQEFERMGHLVKKRSNLSVAYFNKMKENEPNSGLIALEIWFKTKLTLFLVWIVLGLFFANINTTKVVWVSYWLLFASIFIL